MCPISALSNKHTVISHNVGQVGVAKLPANHKNCSVCIRENDKEPKVLGGSPDYPYLSVIELHLGHMFYDLDNHIYNFYSF